MCLGGKVKTLASAGDLEEIRRRIGALTAADRGLWGRMSVAEMVCHVRESYGVGLGERTVEKMKSPMPPRLLKFLALRTAMKWPQGVATLPELQVGAAWMQPGEFRAEQAGLLVAVDRFAADTENRTEHAIFGEMTPKDWLRWGYLHADHHLRQFGR